MHEYIPPIFSAVTLYCVVLPVCLPNTMIHLLLSACELTLLRPLWRLFMSMENSLSQDPTSITVLLPLHRALSELFFIAEARAVVSDSHIQTHTLSMQTTCVEVELLSWAVAPFRCLFSFMGFFYNFFFCVDSIVDFLGDEDSICLSAFLSFSLFLGISTYIILQPSKW